MQSLWLTVLRRLGVVLVATAALVAATAVPGVVLSNRDDSDEREIRVHFDAQVERLLERARDPEALEELRRRLESIPPMWVEPEAARLYECLFKSDEDDENDEDCERP